MTTNKMITETHKVLILVPCYNEEQRLPASVFTEYSQANPEIDFLFVNDGSSDGTQTVIDQLCQTTDSLFAYELKKNKGKAGALREAVLQYEKVNEYDYVGYWDADLATPLEEINIFVQTLASKDFDILMGSRVKLMGRDIQRKMSRHYIGRVFASLASIVLDMPVYDTQCGAKLIKTNLIKELMSEPLISKWLFDVELLQRYKKSTKEISIAEIPLQQWHDIDGSKLKATDFLKAPLELLMIAWTGRK